MPITNYPPEQGQKIGWFILPPTRYILARACLLPLTLACGVGLILSIVGIPLTSGNQAYQAVESIELIIFIFSALWSMLQLATISHRDFFLHQTRVWAWSLGVGFLLQAAVFAGWIATVKSDLDCAPLPACESTLGGYCPQDQLDIYNEILVCELNWGMLGANIGMLSLEFCAILTVFIMRVLPAWQAPERGIWYGSIYAPWDVKWRFERSGNTPSVHMPTVDLTKFNPFKRSAFREPQPPAVHIITQAMRDPPDTPATTTTFASDKSWLKMKGLSGPASTRTETTFNGSRRSSMV